MGFGRKPKQIRARAIVFRAPEFTLLFLLLALFALCCFAAEEQTVKPAVSGIDEAELVLKKASGLDDFLAHPEWIEEYYTAMARYYGAAKFSRKSFDAVMEQLGRAKEEIPGLKERLWSTKGLGPSFRVEAAPELRPRRGPGTLAELPGGMEGEAQPSSSQAPFR